MKKKKLAITLVTLSIIFAFNLFAQDDVTIVTPSSEVAEGLDLK